MVANDMTRDVILVALAELGACSPKTLLRLAERIEDDRAAALYEVPGVAGADTEDALAALVSILHAVASSPSELPAKLVPCTGETHASGGDGCMLCAPGHHGLMRQR
jgi:hypothetical protein